MDVSEWVVAPRDYQSERDEQRPASLAEATDYHPLAFSSSAPRRGAAVAA